MKKIIFITFISMWLSILSVNGQQLPLYSQYLLNSFVINPASAGVMDYSLVQTNVRYQWEGFHDAPRTFNISANIPNKQKKIGTGGFVFTDITGPVSRFGINLAYAYHVEMGNDLILSMGMFGGLMQYQVNGEEILLADEEERYLFEGVESAIVPDASFGTYLYTDRGFVGFSFNHLLQNKLKTDLFNKDSESFGYLSNHLFITGGYLFELNSVWDLEPSLLLKIISPLPPQMDASIRVLYDDEIWLGIQYRTQDAIVIAIGYEYKKRLIIGYSYDFTTSNIKNYSSGSHEVMLGYKFGVPASEGNVPFLK
ncbi:MAG TPA: type IX secretion system membrane protein PorP/SprF [Flavobacteriales bacterium]|nr:type IX secretion system membrane protein PorP/SprF [Flavobacteriales bacterium]